jgi:hypothetical protein
MGNTAWTAPAAAPGTVSPDPIKRGTEGSNPFPSTGESDANRTSSTTSQARGGRARITDGPLFRPLKHNGKRRDERRRMDPDAIDRVVRKSNPVDRDHAFWSNVIIDRRGRDQAEVRL